MTKKYGSGDEIETYRKGGDKIEEGPPGAPPMQKLEEKTPTGVITMNVTAPYQSYRDGLLSAPLHCKLWKRRDGSQWVLFPDGSKHDPTKVGFGAEAWRTAEPFDTSPPPPVIEEEP